jgi:DNA-binding PadR family transcriptional regulator
MSIASDLLRGNTDTIILASLKEQDSYGYLINKEIMAKTDSQIELKDATLYSAFRRLEKDGLVSTYWGDEEVGARRRYYSITDKGREVYEQNKAEWLKAKQMIDSLLV